MSYEDVAGGELAAIVTFLEMFEKPAIGDDHSKLGLRFVKKPEIEPSRRLFRRVGSPWLWFSRLIMDQEALEAIITDFLVELHVVVDEHGDEVGMLELDFRTRGECELAFVGLVPELSGQGHGRWLLGEALNLAWRNDVARTHVHTCSLDHPAALKAYRRAGFRPFRRAIERFPDPRLLGVLPRDCAPQIPIIEP